MKEVSVVERVSLRLDARSASERQSFCECKQVVGDGGVEPLPLDLDGGRRGDQGAHPGGRPTEEPQS